MSYSYKLHLHKNGQKEERSTMRYTRSELEDMTTFQLRNICYKEKLVKGLINTLDREALIQTILRFKSAEESLLIDERQEGGFKKVEDVLRQYLQTPLSGGGEIKIPARMMIYTGLRIDRLDQYRVEGAGSLTDSNVLIVNDHMELCGILHLVRDEVDGSCYLTTKNEVEIRRTTNKNYSLLFFRKQDSEYIYRAYYNDATMPPANLHYYKIPIADLEFRELEQTETVLAIDFGTSNTTAGAFLDNHYVSTPCSNDLLNGRIQLGSINFVTFPDRTGKDVEWIEILPTVVAVADCADPKHVTYHFGYEALKYMRKNGYSGHASVFHGIKRWVNRYRKTEEVMDGHGNTAFVKRSDILQAYMLYVIQTAEHQFKCRFKNLHISSPVKLKTQFLDMFTNILPEYHIESDNALDEGMAVLFNTIAAQIEKNQFLDGEEYKALVIDCGGGTTDLSSCRFRIEDGRISYKIDIHTNYENGDTNFGGNNITYRIMQFMKIIFAEYYSTGRVRTDMDILIPVPSTDIFRHVDECGVQAVYEAFDAAYGEAENIIPTRFTEYENRTRDEYQRVKNNFYFLWEIAEEMKKEFFQKTGILRNRFYAESEHRREHDLKITPVDRWFLSVRENGRFTDRYECPDVVFTITEINQLIRADIYEIVRKFLEGFYEEGKLQEYVIIKLTGQSCRIDVFREALKEFVPGRSIEFRQKADDTGKVPDLKLACLRGAIRYVSARKAGAIEASITNHAPLVPYSVTAFTHNQREKVLIQNHEKLSQVQGFISRPISVSEVELYVNGSDGQRRYPYTYRNRSEEYRAVQYEDIAAMYGSNIPQEDTDSIGNGEVRFFVFARPDHWGFHVVPVSRQNEQLYVGKKAFVAFEADLSELDYFDGWK
ncbi:molecular chaperone [Aneurinibacillus uraniidurans]|uniref:molecular chaperone n=1 Tax=Aneurinibacillus uraniidurans TaxID=2966586 RepID=UPI00234A940C|nr:molecular chaperone [Aneurinibacillus sp. B1]WCN36420.1 molecular chaperone [Aneurinibacillus sp. B1]